MQKGNFKEKCGGTMNLNCSDHSVTIIKQARFGRMEDSKCAVGQDIGCWVDVLPILTTICSGKRSCGVESGGDMNIIRLKKDRTKENKRCTNPQLKDNLGVEYECQQVVLPSKSASCVIHDKKFGNISSDYSRKSGCGFDENPIVIEPPVGNYEITMKLIYFGKPEKKLLGYSKILKSGELKYIYDSSSSILEKVKSKIEIFFDDSVKAGYLKDFNFLVSFQGYSIKIFPLKSNKRQPLSKFIRFVL